MNYQHFLTRQFKRLFILLVLLVSTGKNNAQESLDDILFFPSFEYSIGKLDNSLLDQFSLNLEARAHKNFGFNWGIDFVYGANDYREFHVPGGLYLWHILGPELGILGAGAGLVSLILPEGVTGHFKINEFFEVSPYVNFLAMDYFREKDWSTYDWGHHFSAGVKTTFNRDTKIVTGLFAEVRKTQYNNWSYRVGVSVGLGAGAY